MGDFDELEGHDPKREDEATTPQVAEEPAPQPEPVASAPVKDEGSTS
jgi:hypothetical protein